LGNRICIAGGASFKLCTSCFGSRPLSLSIIGRAAWFNSDHSINLTSRAFGFNENIEAGHFHQYGFGAYLSTPIGGSSGLGYQF